MSDLDVLIESLRIAEIQTIKSIESNTQALVKVDQIRQTFVDVGGARPPRALDRAILDLDDAKKMLREAEGRAQEALRDIRSYLAELTPDAGGGPTVGALAARAAVGSTAPSASEGAESHGVLELSSTDPTHRRQLNKPPANATVVVDERFRYETDGQGRVVRATATLDLIDLEHPRSKNAQRTLVGKLPGDHAGHLFARIFQGPLGKINLTPMEGSKVNLGQYATLEKMWRKDIEGGRSVRVFVELEYPVDDRRPDIIDVGTEIGGRIQWVTIENKPRAGGSTE